MRQDLLIILSSCGLDRNEAQIYLSLLEAGNASASELAALTHIKRSTVYVIIERLKKLGFVSSSQNMTVQRFNATTPEVLVQTAEERVRAENSKLEKIQKALPLLKAKHPDTKNRPNIKIFEGKNGLIGAFEDTLNAQEKILRVSSTVGNLFNVLSDYFPSYVERRRAKKIKMWSIHPDDAAGKFMVNVPPTNFDKPLLIPADKYKFPADLAIYDNKIAYMSLVGKGMAIIIESKEMAEVMKSVFDLAYEEATRLALNKIN